VNFSGCKIRNKQFTIKIEEANSNEIDTFVLFSSVVSPYFYINLFYSHFDKMAINFNHIMILVIVDCFYFMDKLVEDFN